MFIAFFILFLSIIIGIIVLVVYVTKENMKNAWGHATALIHPILILFSALIYFLGKLFGGKLKFGHDENDIFA